MKRLLALAALALSLEAGACGVCIDDKIASCYDHAVVEAAKRRGHAVAFFAIEGDVVRSAATRRAVARAVEAAAGVRRGSVRVSLENAAFSFAYDPARVSPQRAGEAIAGALKLRVKLLRVLG